MCRELIDISSMAQGDDSPVYVEGACDHCRTTPVTAVTGELVAWLCQDCDAQLPQSWNQLDEGNQE